MSYLTSALLSEDVDFGRRSRSCILQQSGTFIDDGRADIAALASALLLMQPSQTQVMLNAVCNGPGFDTTVDNGDGTITSSKIADDDILAQTQSIYPTVAGLFYNDDGTVKPPA
jgi:hypothetical protein